MASALADIDAYWNATATLNTAIPTNQVWAGLAPESVSLNLIKNGVPYATITSLPGHDIYTTGKSFIETFMFTLHVFATTFTQAQTLAQTCWDQLSWKQISAVTISCIPDGPVIVVPDEKTPAKVYMSSTTFAFSRNQQLI